MRFKLEKTEMYKKCVKLPLVIFVIFITLDHGIIPNDLEIPENTDKVFQKVIKHLYTDHYSYSWSSKNNEEITMGYKIIDWSFLPMPRYLPKKALNGNNTIKSSKGRS